MEEEWLPCREFPDNYEISSVGRVRRSGARTTGTRPGRIRKGVTNKAGYVQFMLSVQNRQSMRDGHRLVADAFLGPIPPGLTVNHKNGVKSDNRVENLEIVTHGENIAHSYRVLGTRPNPGPKGLRHFRATLTWGEVCAIRAAYNAETRNGADLAHQYQVTRTTINRIVRLKTRLLE